MIVRAGFSVLAMSAECQGLLATYATIAASAWTVFSASSINAGRTSEGKVSLALLTHSAELAWNAEIISASNP